MFKSSLPRTKRKPTPKKKKHRNKAAEEENEAPKRGYQKSVSLCGTKNSEKSGVGISKNKNKIKKRLRGNWELHHPRRRSRREVAQMLLLSPATLRFVAPPGETHDDRHDDCDLDGSDDGCDQDVVQLLPTRDHVQDVIKVQQLVALRPAVRRLAPAGGEAVSHLTLAVFTELGVVFRTGGEAILKPLSFSRFGHRVNVRFEFRAVVFSGFILAAAHMLDVNLELFEAGSFSDVTRRVVGDAVAATDRVLIVTVTHDVTHA